MRPGETWDSLARGGFYPAPRGCLALTYFVPKFSTSRDDFECLVLPALEARGLGEEYALRLRAAVLALDERTELLQESAIDWLSLKSPLALRARAALTVLTEEDSNG